MTLETTPERVVIAEVLKHLRPHTSDVELDHVALLITMALNEAGLVVIQDEPDHYVTFDETGWFVEHSIVCRVAGTLGTCEYNKAIREIADELDELDPEQAGRWRITEIDSEGLPSLERAPLSDQ